MLIEIIVSGIEIIICYLLQSSVFSHFELANVVPDLLMVFVVAVAYMRGTYKGLFAGLFAGLLLDICNGDVIGLFAFFYMLIGFLNGYAHKIYDKDDYTIPIVLIGVSELLYCLMIYVSQFMLRGRFHLGYYMYRIMLPRVFYTVVIGILLYKLFHMMHYGVLKILRKEE